MNEKLLNRKQLAAFFAVKPDTVKKWQRSGIVKPYCRINGRPRYRLEDCTNLLTSKSSPHAK